MQDHSLERRTFLKLLATTMPQTGVGLGSLAAMGNLAAQTASDTKFLICLYMRGGNDQSNTVIPTSTSEYQAYRDARPTICLDAATTLPISPDSFSGPSLGLHPGLPILAQLFNQGTAAILANVGNLVVPTTLAQWNKGMPSVPVPVQLFSHSDQETLWQSGTQRPSQTGWLGRTADLLMDTYNPASQISMCMSIGHASLMVTGSRALAYKITPWGSPYAYPLQGTQGSGVAIDSFKRLYQQNRSNLMESQVGTTLNRSMNSEVLVSTAQRAVKFSTVFPATLLGQQFYGVARMMSSAKALNQRRQVFYVDIDGFDVHDGLVAQQANRFSELNDAISAFYAYLQETGLLSQSVVFTASDFGRALQSNGKGADHGWGSHHFIFGGPVIGKRIYGHWPTVALRGPEDGGQGRLIPTTSLDQYGATLASWLGVSSTDISKTVLPNIGNFASANLGFLRA